jgi:glycosyltransferase involved in cell wall biosynthesis
LDDNALRNSLAESGRRHAMENFNWTAVGSVYTRIIRDLIADSS